MFKWDSGSDYLLLHHLFPRGKYYLGSPKYIKKSFPVLSESLGGKKEVVVLRRFLRWESFGGVDGEE